MWPKLVRLTRESCIVVSDDVSLFNIPTLDSSVNPFLVAQPHILDGVGVFVGSASCRTWELWSRCSSWAKLL